MTSAFDSAAFRASKFEPRLETVTLRAMQMFFPADVEPSFIVRSLTASELQKANDASTRQQAVDGVVKAIATKKDQVDAIRKALGLTQDTPGEIVKRIEMLVQGCVEPRLDHVDAVKLAEAFPVEFYELTNAITKLTGQGGTLVKP